MNVALRFTSDPVKLRAVRDALRDFLAAQRLDESDQELLVLAVDEACSNIIRHAYENTPGRPVLIRMERRGDSLRILLRDFGRTCDPKSICGRALDQPRPGGLGVHLMNRAFHEISYRPRMHGTELRLVRKLS